MKQYFKCFIYCHVFLGWAFVFSFFCFMPIVAASPTPLLPLEQMEALISEGPEAMAALSVLTRDEAEQAREKQRNGAKYFSGVTYGHSIEPVFDTSESTNRYDKLTVTGGLTFPILGTLQKERIGDIEADLAAIKSRRRFEVLLQQNLSALRKAYAALWIEQQKEELAKLFLTTEVEVAPVLQERQAQGWLLPADRLEFLSVYQDVRRDLAASRLRQMQALQTISLATGRDWTLPEKLPAPGLPSIAGKTFDLAGHPEVVFRNQLIVQYEKKLALGKRMDRDGSLTIGITAGRDFPGTVGKGAYISLVMTEPVKGMGGKDPSERAAAAEWENAKQEYALARMKLAGEAEESLARATYAAASVNARLSHLIVMAESIRENSLRRTVLTGDTFEQLQRSKSQYYKAAQELLDQELQLLQAAVAAVDYFYPRGLVQPPLERVGLISEQDVLRQQLFAPHWLDAGKQAVDRSVPLDFSGIENLKFPAGSTGLKETVAAKSRDEKRKTPWGRMKAAVYVWTAEPFLNGRTRTTEIDEVMGAGFSRILISLSRQQITRSQSPQGRIELESLLRETQSKGLRVDLLLGDPAWLETHRRDELLTLVSEMRDFAFDGIHLDIEPDSLPDAASRRPELLNGLADTVKAAREITSLPISLSLHPRYLEGDLGALSRQKLLPLGLEEVAVMVYSSNPHITARRMAAIRATCPQATFWLAQSVEKNIPPEESYADRTPQEFNGAMRILEDRLADSGVSTILIQAWEDYKKGNLQ